jgi:hypothetical protein
MAIEYLYGNYPAQKLKELYKNKNINQKNFLQKCGNLRAHIIGMYKRDALTVSV